NLLHEQNNTLRKRKAEIEKELQATGLSIEKQNELRRELEQLEKQIFSNSQEWFQWQKRIKDTNKEIDEIANKKIEELNKALEENAKVWKENLATAADKAID